MQPSTSSPPPGRYQAYLLRLWREREDGPWRISLQTSTEQERLGFADLESLVSYLAYSMGDGQGGHTQPITDTPIYQASIQHSLQGEHKYDNPST